MYDHMIEEMADAIAKELHLEPNAILPSLHRFWHDKIAHVWQVEDIYEAARRVGKAVTREDAIGLLQDVFHHHDSSLGITWDSLDAALEDYRLDLSALPEVRLSEVHGIFKVWRAGNLIANQFGLYPNQIDGNLPDALSLARKMAKDHPGEQVHLGLEDNPDSWLTLTLIDDEIHIEEYKTLEETQ
ncbi:MAG: hypothetical protein KPEEDBHJ_00164 [Anaerolineales bacterium]|nr:hypothetical protein [Anaerolineales bacterium]